MKPYPLILFSCKSNLVRRSILDLLCVLSLFSLTYNHGAGRISRRSSVYRHRSNTDSVRLKQEEMELREAETGTDGTLILRDWNRNGWNTDLWVWNRNRWNRCFCEAETGTDGTMILWGCNRNGWNTDLWVWNRNRWNRWFCEAETGTDGTLILGDWNRNGWNTDSVRQKQERMEHWSVSLK